MFFLLFICLLYSIYIFRTFLKRENMRQNMMNMNTQTEYDSEIDDDGHLDEEEDEVATDPVNVDEIVMNHDSVDEFINTPDIVKRRSWW